MKLWYAFQVETGGSRCVGEVWATDADEAYALAATQLRCRVDFVSLSD